MTRETEQLMRVAKKVLAPDKYKDFIDNYILHAEKFCGSSFAIAGTQPESGKLPYSAWLLDDCSEAERGDFWMRTDKSVRLTVVDNVHQKSGSARKLSDIVALMQNPGFRSLDKMSRPLMFSTSDGRRPVGEQSILSWNGFQVIDLDIKDEELAQSIRGLLFDNLRREPWFLAATLSSSGKGVHVWTKIAVPSGLGFDQLKTLFALNFRHKYSAVYITIEKTRPELAPADIVKFMDVSMFKPQQGVFIPASQPLINAAFRDLPITFESMSEPGRIYSDQEWVTAKPLVETFDKWEWFASYNKEKDRDVEISPDAITASGSYELNGVKYHYKHKDRWKLANTLCSIYGFEEALRLFRAIVTDDVPTSELRGDLLTANKHNKPISLWAVRMLNARHGFNIKCEGADTWNPKTVEKSTGKEVIYDLWQERGMETIDLNLRKDQWLSDIAEDIRANLGHITVLEAGAGFGKTEMVKRLGGRVILVLPFTSIIESKFSDSGEWECFYQNRNIDKADLQRFDKLCMTVDKFSQLAIMDVNFSYFDYIVIDESHLLFLSDYRQVMSAAVDNLAHSSSKVIMMTGTTSGEIVFFPGAKHIRVTKEETRVKSFQTVWGNRSKDTRIQMANAMADAIMEGRKVLFPTNSGSAFYETLVADINRRLFYSGFERSVRSVYYKKANEGAQEMDKITFEKTIADLDLVACTSYLSVGVDICDKYDFEIFFDRLIIAQDIEQYANRLRNNNLHIKLYLPRYDENGDEYDYSSVMPFTMDVDVPELATARDIVKMCNSAIARSSGEYRYEPIIQAFMCASKYIQFSDDLGMYYVDETAFKLHIFEKQYREYASQLPVVRQAMEQYGYVCSDTDEYAFSITKEMEDEIDDLNKDVRRSKYEKDTIETFQFLRAINDNNIDMLLETDGGRIPKKLDAGLDRPFLFDGKILRVRNPELFEKNMPLVRGFYRYYDFDTIIGIFDFCMGDKSRRVNYSMLKRVQRLVDIEFNRRKGRVHVSILRFMKEVKEWIGEGANRSETAISEFIRQATMRYVKRAGEFLLSNADLIDRTYDMIKDLFQVLVTKGKKAKGSDDHPLTLNKLLWTEKTDYSLLYGNKNTRIFFIGDILEKEEQPVEEEIVIPDEPDVELNSDALDPSLITSTMEYKKYAAANTIIQDRFMKQAQRYSFDDLLPHTPLTDEPAQEEREATLFDAS